MSRLRGNVYEDLATQILTEKGYQILERQFRYKKSEIDLIMSKGELLVFIEVKMRSSGRFGWPEEFLSKAQQARIHSAATEYLEKSAWKGPIRFDIIAVVKDGNDLDVEHFEDAF